MVVDDWSGQSPLTKFGRILRDSNNRRVKHLLILLCLLAALGGVFAAYSINHHTGAPVGALTGMPVSSDVGNRRPIAVMLDNLSPDARPQSGLNAASMVYETLAEGGITRFMAIYLENDAPMIGPVRSTRFYYNSWAAGLGVIFGHDGGNVDSLQELPGLTTIYNEDADKITGPFYRISSRVIPHNEYTSTTQLRLYAESHGGSTTGPPASLPHKDNAPIAQRPAQLALHIQFSYADYNVDWQFDRASDTYLRSMGGAPHVEASTGKQLTANNVVVMYTQQTAASDPFTPGAIRLRTEGSGNAVVYQDGVAIPGTWSKPSVDSPLQWLDRQGNPIPLNRGVTWVEVVPQGNQVTTS